MRLRLICALMFVTLMVVLVQDIPLGSYLVGVERDRLTTSLERDAFLLGGRSSAALTAGVAIPAEVATDVRRYGRASGARVVIVNAAGTAAATSDDDQSSTGSSYGSRPEIAAALTGKITSGQRYSETLRTELVYVAVPVLSGEKIVGAVRLTYPASVVDDEAAGHLRTLWTVAGTTVALAGFLAFLMASAVTSRLHKLRKATELIADGHFETRTAENEGAPELRALASAFNRMAAKLEHLLIQQRGFASDASHQLRTPLTALRLKLENAADTIATDPDAGAAMVAASLEETSRLQHIIDGLLKLNRAEGQFISPTENDLSQIARSRQEQWQALAEETGVRISVQAAPRAAIFAIPGAPEQIIDNLIDNALAVSPEGSQIQLVIAKDAASGTVELHVLDEGPGLSPDECERAFNRFWRAQPNSEGSGLGLSIVQQLAQASGARAVLSRRANQPGDHSQGLDACVQFRAAD
ncbi:Sensor protein RstB [Arthrobacter sp. SO5]|uniref:sensor histidine kinase n=1 Tax=Arthrobacter sp. SO5 TaxID=1897055 RepID=UPI001E3F2614|nr:ATP-binding protein [Arthrobacter sp. SO5]MCB5275347.1 Sensor protein RstB [Arthrobacter sp. SO5]